MDKQYQTYFFDIPAPASNAYPSNYVSTTKYNIFTFFPLALLRQFKRYANIYFLISTVLQCIPIISPLSPISAIAALMFVIGTSMTREGYEDWKRYKNDKKSNSSKCLKLDESGNETQIEWKDLRPSDLLKIYQDQQLPADIIPLVSSEQSGLIYLQTASLDGQKNLKPKTAVVQTQTIYNDDPKKLKGIQKGRITCIEPNANLYQFEGKLILIQFQQQIQLTHKNLLLRGSVLKNTQFIIGLVCYTGHSTKIMMNSLQSPQNISRVENRLNKYIFGILIFECICCALSAIFNFINCTRKYNFIKFMEGDISCSVQAGISFASYFILYNTFIPISLIVTLEIIKVFQGYFTQKDPEMYSHVTERATKANTVSINEELGQIQFILSDKTGTLTCNKMIFKQVAIGKILFGDEQKIPSLSRVSSVQSLRNSYRKSKQSNPFSSQQSDSYVYQTIKKMLKNPVSKKQLKTIQQIIGNQRQVGQEMMNILTTCHQCLRQTKSNKYQGPSPDEVALVQAARKSGYEFLSIQNKVIKVDKLGFVDTFEVLQVFQFDSDRKRMSIIVEHLGILKLYTKGADATVLPLLSKDNQPFLDFINESASSMSKKGLRSLYYTMKILPNDIKSKIPVQAESVQNDLTLIGLTGIEDKLQDFVPQTISALRSGGIKFVLLTGDKLQTAQNISKSCGLINQCVSLTSNNFEQMSQVYQKILQNKELGVIADGSKVNFNENKALLSNIIINADSTVLCRVTPKQKAEVVKMVKDMGKSTLAVGDGANDCNMILEANVGVGIFGKQGTRAAQVSNYSIGQFCLLWKLILYHGRLNYIRICQMILYFFYKNMVFTIPQFVYSFYTMSSGKSVYLAWSITLFNLAFTLLPIAITSVLQTDVYISADKNKLIEVSQKQDPQQKQKLYQYYPKLYYIGRNDTIFTVKNFITWFVLGALQGTLCILINLYTLTNVQQSSGKNSHPMSFYFLEISLCTCIVIIVNIKLALNIQRWSVILLIGFILTAIVFVLYAIFCNFLGFSPTKGYYSQILTVGNFYLAQVLSIFGMLAIDVLLYSISLTQESIQNQLTYAAATGEAPSGDKIQDLDKSLQNLTSQEPKTIQQIQKQEQQKPKSISKTSSQKQNTSNQDLKVPLLKPN